MARHHVFYRQHIAPEFVDDERNLVVVAFVCHGRHHSAFRRYPLEELPDSVFEFGVEVFGPGRAHDYLRRRYGGEDPRLYALIGEAMRAA